MICDKNVIAEITARHGLSGLGLYVYMCRFDLSASEAYEDEFLYQICNIEKSEIDLVVESLVELKVMDLCVVRDC